MATLTTDWQYLGQAYIGKSGGSLYVRVYARYTQQDIANNRSYVQYQARAYYENGTYILDEQGTIGVSGTGASYQSQSCTRPTTGETNAVSTEGWVYHNADGTQSISCAGSISFPNWGWSNTAYGSASLPTIPRQANLTNAPNFTDEENPTISYSNSAGNSVSSLQACISLTGSADDIKYRDVSKTGSSYTFNLTEAERNVLREASKNSEKINIKFFLRTVISGNTYYSILDRTVTIVNAKPTFNDYTYEDINETTLNLTGNNQSIIKGISKLKAIITPENKAVAKKKATMSYYQIDDVKSNYSSTETVSIIVNGYDKEKITCLAVDSRGNSTPIEKNISNFIAYVELVKKSLSLTRSDNGVGEFVNLSFSGTFWNGNFGLVDNELTVSYRYKKTTKTEYTEGTTTIIPTINGNNFSFNNLIAGDTEQNGFDINESYDIDVIVKDKLTEITYSSVIGTGIPAIAVYKNKVALGDKYDTSLGGIQLWGDIYINGKKIYSKGTEE